MVVMNSGTKKDKTKKAYTGHNLLTYYGKPIKEYHGEGILTEKDGTEMHCRFEAGQLTDGSILLLCDFLPPFRYSFQIEPVSFKGKTTEGFSIWNNRFLYEVGYLPNLPTDSDFSIMAAFHLQELAVQFQEGQNDVISFGITNFEFIGIKPNDSGTLSLPLNLSDSRKLEIQPIHDYNWAMNCLHTLKNIEITCEVFANLKSAKYIYQIEDSIGNLCYLMSVARGTKIQWIYYNLYNSNGKLLKIVHSARITKRYCPLSIIDPRVSGREETKDFLEKAYPVYMEKRESYKLDKGMIDAYLDAKAENDFLQLRGVKLAVTMEMLKTIYKNINVLNRTSFADLLLKLCDNVNLKTTREDVKLFVECRNKLIHEGQFYCLSATPKEIKNCKPLPTSTNEYFFLLNFVDKIFLKLFGYSGSYIDWSTPGKPERERLL